MNTRAVEIWWGVTLLLAVIFPIFGWRGGAQVYTAYSMATFAGLNMAWSLVLMFRQDRTSAQRILALMVSIVIIYFSVMGIGLARTFYPI